MADLSIPRVPKFLMQHIEFIDHWYDIGEHLVAIEPSHKILVVNVVLIMCCWFIFLDDWMRLIRHIYWTQSTQRTHQIDRKLMPNKSTVFVHKMEMDWSLVCITKYCIRIERKKTTRNAIFGLEKMLCWFVMAIPQWQIQCNAMHCNSLLWTILFNAGEQRSLWLKRKSTSPMDTPIENKAPTWIPTMSNNTIFLWCFTDWTALLLLLHQVESFFALPPLARSHFTSSIIIIVKSYNCYCVFWLLFSSRCVFWFRLLYVLLRLVFMLFLLLHLSECRHAIRSIFTVWLNVISRSLALSLDSVVNAHSHSHFWILLCSFYCYYHYFLLLLFVQWIHC